MALIIRNQQNNWAYIFILVMITAVVAGIILYYTHTVIQEINSFSSVDLMQ